MGRPSKRLYATSDGFVFMQPPNANGAWARVHRSVVMVACPTCGSPAGELCRTRKPNWHGEQLKPWWASVHYQRRYLVARKPLIQVAPVVTVLCVKRRAR